LGWRKHRDATGESSLGGYVWHVHRQVWRVVAGEHYESKSVATPPGCLYIPTTQPANFPIILLVSKPFGKTCLSGELRDFRYDTVGGWSEGEASRRCIGGGEGAALSPCQVYLKPLGVLCSGCFGPIIPETRALGIFDQVLHDSLPEIVCQGGPIHRSLC